MSDEKKQFVDRKVAQILLSKNGKEYLKFTKDVEFKEGDTCFLNNFADGIDKSVERGSISKEKGEQLKEKMHFVLYNVETPADKDN